MSVVDGVTHDDHGGEGEVVLFHDLRQVLQFSPVYPLVFPREMVAGGDGGGWRVVLHQFGLHLINDRGTEKDAHRALRTGQQVEFLFFRHRGTSFSAGKDDCLHFFGDGEL